jgi:hypothetical protein
MLPASIYMPEVQALKRNSRSIVGVLLAGILVMVFASCSSDDEGGSRICLNCDFWDLDFGGVGRYPAASPDPQVIAFSSDYLFPSKMMGPVDRDNLGLGDDYNIWIARTEAGSDTVWYHQITTGGDDDFFPAWSPDGNTIAFERTLGEQDERQVFIVDVTDFESPGTPVQVTDRTTEMFNSKSPGWAVIGGETWISFSTGPKGGGDTDIAVIRYPDFDSLATVSLDPADFARDENGVMSYVFSDQKPAANGSQLLAFASPDRLPVGDFEVIANTEEEPGVSVQCPIYVNGKDSGKITPYTFRYRPAGVTVNLSGELPYYCVPALLENFAAEADTVVTALLDFVHVRGTLGVRSVPGGLDVYVDDQQVYDGGVPVRTPVSGEGYSHVRCLMPGEVSVSLKNVFGDLCGDPVTVEIAMGETTFVSFSCEGSAGPGPVVSGSLQEVQGAAEMPRALPVELLAQGEDERGIWVMDLGTDVSTDDDRIYRVQAFDTGSNFPVLSPDGRYVAYFRGIYTSWELVVADILPLLEGSGDAVLTAVGLPGSTEDIECWRKPEKLCWLPPEAGHKLVVSLSPCRGGGPADYSIYVVDLDGRLP